MQVYGLQPVWRLDLQLIWDRNSSHQISATKISCKNL
jgi:hypothetical protein